MRRVIIESPYRGDDYAATELNIKYARACVRDALLHGEAPLASHLLYTQEGILDDKIADERTHGIHAGFAWREMAQATIFYMDRGWSQGMKYGLEHAEKLAQDRYRVRDGHDIEYRTIGMPWSHWERATHGDPRKFG